jgi:hypothetical protein
MAKGQARSNREVKKPKQPKKVVVPGPVGFGGTAQKTGEAAKKK